MSATIVRNRGFRITPPAAGQLERIEYRSGRSWTSLGTIKYHVSYWLGVNGKTKTLRLKLQDATSSSMTFVRSVAGLGEFQLQYRLPDGQDRLEVSTRFICRSAKTVSLGFYAPAIDFPSDADAVRLMIGCYGGFTRKGTTVLFTDGYDDARGPRQAAFAVDMVGVPKGTMRAKYQYMTQSFPPAYLHGAMDLANGEEVVGQFTVSLGRRHIWDPAVTSEHSAAVTSTVIEPPRFSLQQYIDNWEHYAREKDLWVPLGPGMGMNHVGFYGMLSEPKIGGPYGSSLKGRLVRYAELWEYFYGRRRHEKVVFKGIQLNRRTLEIGWGNGCNAMMAYSYFLHGKTWSVTKAKAIVNAILGLHGHGFALPSGPLKGAWINGYDVEDQRFQDHYGGDQVFLPDQGIVNYFLTRCVLEGFTNDPRIVERVRTNCDEFLARIEERYGTYHNAFSGDGSIGYSREGVLYDWPNAPALAMVMLSYLCCYQLTRETRQLRRAADMLRRWLAPQLEQFKFGFFEYDHAGWDSSGACIMLMALAEYLAQPDTPDKNLARRLEGLVYDYLLSFRHEHDYFMPAHSSNVLGWGAVAKNKYGFVHGFTPGSRQGMICLHIRWEYGYALMKAYQTAPSARRYAAFMNHLNYFTYQQFVRRDLPKGFGGVTEHTAMAPYVQDTTHTIHSTPLPMIALEHWPLYVSQCQGNLADVQPAADGLDLKLSGPGHVTPERMKARSVVVDRQRCRTGLPLVLGEIGHATTVKLRVDPGRDG